MMSIFSFWGAKKYFDYKTNEQIQKSWEEATASYKKLYEEAEKYEEQRKALTSKYNRMLRDDHYGGKTPEDTLKLFVDALKKKDYSLASKYYVPEKWEQAEREMKKWIEEYPDMVYKFVSVAETGVVKRKKRVSGISLKLYEDAEDKYPFSLEMTLNNVNNIWKISDF